MKEVRMDPSAFDRDCPTFAFDFSTVPYCRANNHESSDHARIDEVKHMLHSQAYFPVTKVKTSPNGLSSFSLISPPWPPRRLASFSGPS